MAETFEASKNILPGDPGTRAELKDLASKIMSETAKIEAEKKAAKLKEYNDKVQSLLKKTKEVSSRGYVYKYPEMVCDTFIKRIFKEIGDDSLKNVSQTYGMYGKYKNSLKGSIIPTANNTFSRTGKAPKAGDLLFFLNSKGVCPHVGILSSYTANGIAIYDASKKKVGYRTVSPIELRGNYGYTSISFAPPFIS